MNVNGSAGQVTMDGAATLTSGTFNGPSTGGKVIFNTGTTTLNGATVNGGSGTIQSAVAASLTSGTWNGGTGTDTFSNTFTLNGAAFNGQTASVVHTGNFTLTTGTYTATSNTTEFQGNTTFSAGGTFAHNNGTVKLNTSSFITYTYSAASPVTYYDLNVSGTNSGTWTLSSGTLNIAHNYLHSSSGTTIGTGTVAFTGAGNTQTMTLTGATGSLDASVTINKSSGTVQLASALVMNAASQNLTVTSGTFALAGNALTVNGTSATVTVGASGTFQLQGGETTTFNASNPTLSSGSTVEYVGTVGPYTIKAWSYKNLTANGTATFTEGANTTVATTLTINSGNIFDLAGFNLTGGGTIANNSGTLRLLGSETVTMTNDTDSGTTTFNGTGNYTVTPGALPLNAYYHLTFSGAAGQWKLGSGLDVNGDLTFTNGSLNGNSQAIALAGSLSVGSGTFTGTGCALTLDGTDQTVNATFTVASLSKTSGGGRTLTLGAGKTITVTGATTLTGTSNVSRLALVSSTPTSTTSLDMQGTKTLQYLSVQDNTAVTAAACFTGCFDNSRNSGWAFEAAALVSHSGGTTDVTEGGATDSFTIVLSGQPASDVTVALTPPADVTLNTSSLTFTNANWATPQTVTVTAVNDDVDEPSPEAVTITLLTSSADSVYNGLSGNVSVAVTDNDASGFTLTESGGTTAVAEGGATDSYTLVLTSQPTADVTVAVAGDADASVAPTSLTFTSANWATPQTVTVTAVDDSLVEGAHTATVTNGVTSADLLYNVLTIANVTVSVTDNDTAGYTVTESGGSTAVTEGGASDTYTVVLTAQPTADVTVNAAGGADLSLSPTSRTFTSGNWNVPQTFTVSAVNDALVEGEEVRSVTHSITSVDADFAGASIASVSVTVTDNDTAGFVLTESGGTTAVTEGGATDSYTLVLTAQPSADVVVTLTVPADLSTNVPTLTFTNANWATPQTVTVTAVDDILDEPSPESATITHTSASADTTFNGLDIGGTTVAVTDNDGTPTLVISDATAGETNGTVDVTVTMTGQSQSTVSVAYATADGTAVAGADYESASGTLTWTSGQTGAKTFQVLLNEDALDEDNETVTLTLSDVVNGALSDPDAVLTITDNDATPTVAWTLDEQNVGEDAGVVAVTAQLSAVSGRNVTVPFAVSGTATTDSDYTFDPVSPLSIPAGTLTAVLQVTVLDDTSKEQNETVVVAIGTPTNATPGANDVQTITILDNEPGGGVRVPPPPSLAAAISLFTPNGGETYRPGDTVQIVWSVPESRVDFLNYAWSSDDGATWTEVGKEVSSAITFAWTVPDVSTTMARFRVEADDLAIVYATDTSDAPFTIIGTAVPVAETPAAGEEPKSQEPAVGVDVQDLPETAISQVTGFPEAVTPLTWGTFVRSASLSTAYYLDPISKTRRAIISQVILRTYGAKTTDVRVVSDATLQFIPLGLPLPPKAGTVLVKVTKDAKVYYLAVPEDKVSDGILRHVVSEYLAGIFFGSGWSKYVIDIPKEFLDILPLGAPLGVGDTVDLDKLRTRDSLSRDE